MAALGLLAWGAVVLAERYYSDDDDLRELALALLPSGAEIVLEDSSECSRSGWQRVLTFRDTCHELRFSLPMPDTNASDAAERAESNGWGVLTEHPNGGLDLARPGYRGFVRLRDEEEIEACVRSSPASPGFCYHSVSVIEGD